MINIHKIENTKHLKLKYSNLNRLFSMIFYRDDDYIAQSYLIQYL